MNKPPEQTVKDGTGQTVAIIPAPLSSNPQNVYEAIARIMDELPAIGKDRKASAQQGGYAYRGIEDITAKLQSLMAKWQVVFTPLVLNWERDGITVANKPWTDDRLLVQYTITHGPSETETTVIVPGVGRDNSDKGTNKALTQAFKYALLQVFCVADPKDDADGTTVEADEYKTEPQAPDPAVPFVKLQEKLGLERQAIGDAVSVATDDRTRNPREATDEERNKAMDVLRTYAAKAKADKEDAEDEESRIAEANSEAQAEALAEASV